MSTENRGKQQVAVYECHCGASVTFPERQWDCLSYMTRKLGFTNIGEFIAHNRECCDRPAYASVGDYASPQEGDSA